MGSPRPPLLSPVLPGLPGGGSDDLGLSLIEPCLAADEYGPPPPPAIFNPLPPSAAHLATAEGTAVALQGLRKHSQLEFCLQQAAAARQRQQRQPEQAERPAQASPRPAAHAMPACASARALSSSSSGEGRGSEGAVSSAALHMHSRASAVLQELQPMEEDGLSGKANDGKEAAADDGGDAAAASDSQAGDAGTAAENQMQAAAAPTAQAAGLQPAGAAGSRPNTAAARRQQRQAQRRAGTGPLRATAAHQTLTPATATATAAAAIATAAAIAAEEEAPSGGEDGGWCDDGVEEAGSPPPPPAPQAAAEDEPGVDEEAGGPSLGKRKRPPAQEASIQAALLKLGEGSWQDFCQKLLDRVEQQEEAAVRGGRGRGRGRGRKAGRGSKGAKGKTGSSTAAEAVQVQDVLNKNSPMFHKGFAAAYHEAKAALDKKDSKRQKDDRLKEHSKLVGRWSELSAQEHSWYLQHKDTVLSVGDSLRMEALQDQVRDEQQLYMAHVQEKAAGVKYQHCTERQGAQLEEDEKKRRQRVQQGLPRYYRLRAILPVAELSAEGGRQHEGERLPLRHLGLLRREGQPPLFVRPADGTAIPGSNIYLPCSIEEKSGSGSRARSSGSGEVYRKADVPAVEADPLLADLAQQAQQVQKSETVATNAPSPLFCLSASAFAAIVSTPMLESVPAWEIPVTIRHLPTTAAAAETAETGEGKAGNGVEQDQYGEQQQQQQQQQQQSSGVLVCLEKPLLPRMMTMRAKQQRLQKYAVLSLGVQHQQQQQQHEEDAEQAQQQQTRLRRSTRSGTATPAPSPPPPAMRPPSILPPRETSYDCWQLGTCRMLVRSHGRMLLQAPEQDKQQAAEEAAASGEEQSPPPPPPPPPADSATLDITAAAAPVGGRQGEQRHVVLAVSPEYFPEPDLEETTMEELCCWWLKLLLRPSVNALMVAHVHVPRGKVHSCEELTAAEIEQQFSGDASAAEQSGTRMRRAAAEGLELLQQLLQAVGQQPPGRYLLCRAPRDTTCCLFRALPPEVEASVQDQAPPLPCSSTVAREGTIYDLHAAHHRSGATDHLTSPFVPPRWRPLSADLQQIPFTFPPRQGQLGRKYAKARQRKALPYAWGVLGEGGDFDQVQHLGQISRADYAAAIGEEL